MFGFVVVDIVDVIFDDDDDDDDDDADDDISDAAVFAVGLNLLMARVVLPLD